MQRLRDYAEAMKGKRVIRINATSAGGGVAIMNAPWVHTMRLLGVDAHWYALKPNEKAAEVTKYKIHNVLQGVSEEGEYLTDEDKTVYEEWIAENKELLEEPISEADVVIVDDWQPSGLIPYIKGYEEETESGAVSHPGINPEATILFRDHIHTEGDLMVTEGTPQKITWDYLWEHNRIKDADVFITHPRDIFVPPNVPNEKVVFMGAAIDLLDDLNRVLSAEEETEGFEFINHQLSLNENQTELDLGRPYIVLIARYDESKGMPQGIEAYAKARARLIEQGVSEENIPQLLVMGNGSVDDPSGKKELAKIMALRSSEYSDIMDDLKVIRVPHKDIAINAALGRAKIALQPSIKEGFESRVTDAIWKGVPVIGSDRGGIPLQIVPGESGFIENPYDTDAWANHIVDLMTDEEMYENMRQKTLEHAKGKNYAFTTIPNDIRWLWLSLHAKDEGFNGGQKLVDDLIKEKDAQRELVRV
jgi:glycosyltransferase involved in cell wall biosynthesis